MPSSEIAGLAGAENIGSASSVIDNKMDPSQFDATMKKLLIGQGADKYVNIFRQHNIGQSTLTILSEDDLIKLGVDDAEIRKNIINMVKDLPISEELASQKPANNHLSLKEITDILVESSDHLNRIYMSLYSTTKALSKEGIPDTLLYEDKYASDVAMSTLTEITNILDSMEHVLQTKMMVRTEDSKQKKKIIVGAVGSAVIITLAVLFAKSLRQLNSV